MSTIKGKWSRRIKRMKRATKRLLQALFIIVYKARISVARKLKFMGHTISNDRAAFIEAIFYEFSFRGEKPNRELFNTLTDPAELHYLASIYNWDDGAEVLNWIINSQYCDRATASLIFWRSQPDYYTQFVNAKEADWAADVYLLLRNIIANWEAGFYARNKIKYNPALDSAAGSLEERNPKEKWSIPEYLKEPIAGKAVLF